MADFTIDAQLKLDAINAIRTVDGLGKKLDDTIGKGNTVLLDTKKAETDIKQLGELADKTLSDAGSKSAGGGMFSGIGESLAGLVSPAGLATAGVAALGAGLAATFTLGKEFETGLQSVSAVTGVTGAALEDIGDRAQGLAAQFGGSAKEQLEVFQTTLSKIGPQLAQDSGALTTFAENVNVLSKTDSALGAAGAVDALTGAMLQFGVNVNDSNEVARESGRFINVLAASAAVGSASVSDVAGAIAVVGATAKNANVSFEETNAALQVLASKSLVGSQAGTALTAVVNKLQSASGPAADQLKKMGTSSEELGKILTTQGIGPAMEKLKTGMNTLGSTSEKNAFLVSLFGETGVNAAAALLSGADQLKQFTAGVTGTNAATEQAAINMATLSERISRGTAALQNIAIDTYRVLAPILSNVIGTISDAFGKVQSAIAPIFAKLTQTFGAVFERIKPIFTAIVGFLGGAWLIQITTIFSAIGTAINVVFTTAIKIFDAVVAAVAPLVDALKKAFGFSDDASKSIDVLKIFGDVLTFISDGITAFGDILIEVGGFIAEFLIAPFKIVISVVTEIVKFFTPATKAVEDTGKAAESTGGFFSTLVDIIKQAPAFIRAVTEGFKAFVGGVTDLITNFSFDKLKNLLTGKTIADAFTGSIDKTKLDKLKVQALEAFKVQAGELADQAARARKVQSDEDIAAFAVLNGLSKKEAQKRLEEQRKEAESSFALKKLELTQKLEEAAKAGKVEEAGAKSLATRINGINLAEATKNAATTAAASVKAGEKAKQDSLKEEIAKTAEENRKLRGESDAVQIKDELERAVKANEEKFLAAQRAVQKEIEETKRKKDVSEKERQELLSLLQEKENLILENGLNQRDDIIAKYNQKKADEALKEQEKETKDLQDFEKKQIDEFLKYRAKNAAERLKIEQDYADKHKGIFEQLADSTTDIFKGITDGFTAAFAVDESAGEAAKKEADTQLQELKKSLQARVISFSDYQDKVAEISAKSADAGGLAGKSFGDKFVDALNNSLQSVSRVFDNIGKNVLKQYEADNKEVADINKELEKELILQKKLGATDTIEQAQEREKTIRQLQERSQKAQIGGLSDLQVAYTSFGVTVGGALLGAIAEGTNLWKAFVLSAFDALQALVPVFTAMILGKELAEKGIFGLATAPILTGLLLIAVNLAKAAATQGFYSGGDTRNTPVGKVAGVVHGQEVIVNHEETHGEFGVFEKVRKTLKGGVHMSEIYGAWENSKRPMLSDIFVGVNGIMQSHEITPQPIPVFSNNDVVGELRELRRENSRLQQSILEATEQMPNAFRGNVKHDFEFHHDPSISIKKSIYQDRRKALQ